MSKMYLIFQTLPGDFQFGVVDTFAAIQQIYTIKVTIDLFKGGLKGDNLRYIICAISGFFLDKFA